MNDTTYNGWANYETWNCKLWIDNDGSDIYWAEEAQRCAQYAIDEADDQNDGEAMKDVASQELAKFLETHFDELQSEQVGVSGMFADILNAAMSRIDWREIAEHMIDDADVDWSVDPESDEAA